MINYIPVIMFAISGVAAGTLISGLMWMIYRPRILNDKLLEIHSAMLVSARELGCSQDARVVARLKSIKRLAGEAANFSVLFLVYSLLEDYRKGPDSISTKTYESNDDVDQFVREYSDWTTKSILTYIFYCTMSGTAVRALSAMLCLGKSCRAAMAQVVTSMLYALEPAALSHAASTPQRVC